MNKQLENKIIEYIDVNKNVTTQEICTTFQLSESSCRRLLQRLQEEGIISRYHGGAFSNLQMLDRTDIANRFNVHEQQKEAIAKAAADLIESNSTVILLGGSTVFRMCKYLKYKRITVITNSIIVFSELKDKKNVKLILLGGEYVREEEELTGVLTNRNSNLFISDHMFMGAAGYIRNTGFTTSDMESLELYSWCIKLSNQVHLLFDSSKFETRGKAITVNNRELTSCITDSGIDAITKKELVSADVNVIFADKEV